MNHNGPGQGRTLPVSRRDQGAMSEERGTTRRGHRSRRGLRRPRTGTVVATVLAVALGGYGWAATRSPGYTTDHLEANDGTVWVTNDRAGLFGRFSAPAAHLDAAVAPAEARSQTYQLDVVQSGSSVLTRDRITGALAPVDVRAGTLVTDQPVTVPASAPLAVGGPTSVVVDTETGEVRAATSTTPTIAAVDGLAASAQAVTRVPIAPDVTGGALAADVEVDPDGTAYAAGSGGRLVTLTPTGDGRFSAASASLGGALQDVHVLVTDDGPVVLDTVAGVLARPGGARTALTGESITDGVPQVRPTGGSVLVATPEALLSVDLRTGATRRLTGGGTAPRPHRSSSTAAPTPSGREAPDWSSRPAATPHPNRSASTTPPPSSPRTCASTTARSSSTTRRRGRSGPSTTADGSTTGRPSRRRPPRPRRRTRNRRRPSTAAPSRPRRATTRWGPGRGARACSTSSTTT